MTMAYILMALVLFTGAVFACLIHQHNEPIPQEILLERLNQRR